MRFCQVSAAENKKPFRARLVLNEDGKVEFEFPERRAEAAQGRRRGVTSGPEFTLIGG